MTTATTQLRPELPELTEPEDRRALRPTYAWPDRLFRGYAGWGPGQLDEELAANAWIVVDADRSDPFTRTPESLWRDVLRRQGGALARMGERIPDDVSSN